MIDNKEAIWSSLDMFGVGERVLVYLKSFNEQNSDCVEVTGKASNRF